jgi:acyl carrier protein
MASQEQLSMLSREEIQSRVIAVLEDMTADWELDSTEGISSETRLMEELAFESIDVVQLVVALEKEFNCKGLPFEQLFMQDGDYVDEILVKDVVDFLSENLKK